ncbi:response regulator [Lysinibacillus sp. KU-BSD001]|uniref:response regulator n=1 Tax=Lysinibacillus sp. KU-BSD001 TaxID=3141328 RepID=UPI0036E9DE90
MISAILVDDEQLALALLQHKLADFPEVTVQQAFLNTQFSLEVLKDLPVNVAFLDIEMGKINGIDLAEMIQTAYPHIHIVFVTAHAEYAVQAFEVNSIDYLLKPVTTTRLKKNIARLKTIVPEQLIEQTQTTHLKIECLHEFQVFSNDELIAFKTAKVKELFAYFIMHQNTPVQRDILIETLWPEQDYKKSKINLHTCLSHLRKFLAGVGFTECISLVNKSYVFTLEHLVSDFSVLGNLLSSVDTIHADNLHIVDECLALYKGHLFEVDHFEWAGHFTQQWMNDMLHLLNKAIDYCIVHDKEKALVYMERKLQFEPYDDVTVLTYMQLYIELGQRVEAVKLYNTYKETLEKELDLKPSEELTNLYESIKVAR